MAHTSDAPAVGYTCLPASSLDHMTTSLDCTSGGWSRMSQVPAALCMLKHGRRSPHCPQCLWFVRFIPAWCVFTRKRDPGTVPMCYAGAHDVRHPERAGRVWHRVGGRRLRPVHGHQLPGRHDERAVSGVHSTLIYQPFNVYRRFSSLFNCSHPVFKRDRRSLWYGCLGGRALA